MFCAKHFFAMAGLASVAVLLGASMAGATIFSPIDIPYHSPDGNYYGWAPGDVDNLIDGNISSAYGDFGVLYDDTTITSPAAPITGYAVFDMGSARNVGQVLVHAKAEGDNVHLMPKSVSFFYYNDDTATGFLDSAAIGSDANVTVFKTVELPDLCGAAPGYATVSFDSVVNKRYIGMRLDSSWHDSAENWGSDASNACSQMAEVQMTDIPEPSAIVLAISGLIGLLCYAWKKRK